MIILHDAAGSFDPAHVHAIANIEEGFALFDYVMIEQPNGWNWIAQIVAPNKNVSTVGSPLDPTILHGLQLMQQAPNVQAVESVQVFELLLLGQWDGNIMTTPRLRPLPGAVVTKLDAEATSRVIGIPPIEWREDDISNAIGELSNADGVPLCITPELFAYHIGVMGGTGSGKSNAAANLVMQAVLYNLFVIIHDAKPDYGLVNDANTDPLVTDVWARFEPYGLCPRPITDVQRVGFFGLCNPTDVDTVIGFRASDFSPEMLAGFFFNSSVSSAEGNAFEGFAGAAAAIREARRDNGSQYSLDDILAEVARRSAPANQGTIAPADQIHELTGRNIQRKVATRRRRIPWLDVVGQAVARQGPQPALGRLRGSTLDGAARQVQAFNLQSVVEPGRVLVIDYANMDPESYALILSYFLRVCHSHRQRNRQGTGILQLVDEAHRVFDNESRHGGALGRAFERVMREGRSLNHCILLSLQNASQIPPRVMNNLSTKIVMRQGSKHEADAATQTMGREFSSQSMRLGVGDALVSVHEARAVVIAAMAPSPFDLERRDNAGRRHRATIQFLDDDD